MTAPATVRNEGVTPFPFVEDQEALRRDLEGVRLAMNEIMAEVLKDPPDDSREDTAKVNARLRAKLKATCKALEATDTLFCTCLEVMERMIGREASSIHGAVLGEREACAVLAETLYEKAPGPVHGSDIARYIRARGGV